MKHQLLKKRLILESAVAAGVLTVLGGLTYTLQSIQEEKSSAKAALEGEVIMVSNETNGLREKYIRLQNNQELYQTVLNLYNADMLSHNTGILSVKFREYEDRFNLHYRAFTSQRATETLDPAKYQRKTNIIALREGAFEFKAISDIDIVNMMKEMKKDFPGAISFTALRMTRENNVNDEILRTITKEGSYDLISGDIRIRWYAIEPTDPEELKRQSESNKRPRRRR